MLLMNTRSVFVYCGVCTFYPRKHLLCLKTAFVQIFGTFLVCIQALEGRGERGGGGGQFQMVRTCQ